MLISIYLSCATGTEVLRQVGLDRIQLSSKIKNQQKTKAKIITLRQIWDH